VPSREQNPFRSVRKTRVSEEIIEQVRDLIVSGRLRAGDRLPPEREFARTLRVGRSALREAIRAMESLGIVTTRPGQGSFVAHPATSQGHNPLTASLYEAWSTQRKLFEVRRLLEPGLAALAARRASGEQIEKLRTALRGQEAEIRGGGTGMKEDTTFHFLIAEATGNEVLLRIVDNLMDLLRKTREESLQHRDRPAGSLTQHQAILKAIEARDSKAAERSMLEHVRAIERLVFSVKDRPGPPAMPSPASPNPETAP
jgi:GntR family transcriptional repressor for pyruvate dehydrogenase complex